MFKFLKRYFTKYGFLYCKHIWKNREARINLEYFKISQQSAGNKSEFLG